MATSSGGRFQFSDEKLYTVRNCTPRSMAERTTLRTASTPVASNSLVRFGGSAARLSRGGFGDNLTTGLENYNKDIWGGRLALEVNNERNVFVRLQADLTQELVRQIFLGISPMAYMQRFAANPKRVLVVHARYDLTFLPEFSLDVVANFQRFGVDYVSKVLPCGHYTTGEFPYKYIDGWYLGSFIYHAFKALALKA